MKDAALPYNPELDQLLEAQEVAEIGSYEWDLASDTSRRSPQLEKILEISEGVPVEEFMQKVHPSDRPRVRASIQEAIAGTGSYDCEFRYQGKTSEKVLWSRGRVTFENGKARSMRGTVMDVTDRHHMIHRLQRSQELYKQAQAATHIGNWSWEIAANKINWSDELYRIYGLEPQSEPITWERFVGFIPEEFRDNYSARLSQFVDSKTMQEYVSKVRLDDGTIKILQVKREVLSDENGKPYKVIGACQDITEKQLLIERLERSEHFIKHIADASPTILYLFDAREGQIKYINNEVTNILGYAPEEILSMGSAVIPRIYHPDDFKKIGERLRKYKQDTEQSLFHFECRMKSRDGEWRWMLIREIVFSTAADHRITEVLGAALDITERKQVEEELYTKTMELERSNSHLEEFAYVASHDLQEPLRKISTFGDRLLSKHRDHLNDEGRAYLDKIVQSSIRMQQMINDLLSISTISGNKAFTTCSLQQLLDEVLQTLEFKLEESKTAIKMEALPAAQVDASQFRQLFQNLISNSIKFSRRDGVAPQITISHEWLTSDDAALFNLHKSDRYLKIVFRDNGIGFEKQFEEQIFVIFQRLHSKNEYEGTGIGLAICKKIIENHGGVIFAKGTPGAGAEFSMIIPAEASV